MKHLITALSILVCSAQVSAQTNQIAAHIDSIFSHQEAEPGQNNMNIIHKASPFGIITDYSITFSSEMSEPLLALARDAAKQGKQTFKKEYHQNGIDTVGYTIVLDDQGNADNVRLSTTSIPTRSQAIGLPHIVTAPSGLEINYHYGPIDTLQGSATASRGMGALHFWYVSKPDHKASKPLDIDDFLTYIQPSFDSEGVTSFDIHYKHSKGFKTTDTSMRFLSTENWSGAGYGETHGKVYKIDSWQNVEQLLRRITDRINQYLDLHTDVDFVSVAARQPIGLPLFESRTSNITQPKLMIIPLPIIGMAGQSGGIATCVMVSVTKGELWIPMEYHRISEYIDSTVTYTDE